MSEPTRYVVIVTGSRAWTDEARIIERLRLYPRGTLVLHGDAPGADTIAARVARRLHCVPVPHPYFSERGKAGGPIRNALLVALGEVYRKFGYTVRVEAFPVPPATGTSDCVRQARKAKFEIWEPPEATCAT